MVFVRSGTGATDAAPIAATLFKRYAALRQARPTPSVRPAPQTTVRVRILSKHHPRNLRITPAGGKAVIYAEAGSAPWGMLQAGEVLRITRQGTQMGMRRNGQPEALVSHLRISPLGRR